MPGEQTAARRYAQAIFAIAMERGSFDRWLDDIESIAALMADPAANALLTRSNVPFDEKTKLVERALNGADPLALNLAKLLVRKRRTPLTPFIAKALREMIDAERGIAHAQVRTAVELSAPERESLVRRLSEITGRQVTVDLQVDPEIIGGIVARVGDQIIDGSARGKLIALRRRLQEATR